MGNRTRKRTISRRPEYVGTPCESGAIRISGIGPNTFLPKVRHLFEEAPLFKTHGLTMIIPNIYSLCLNQSAMKFHRLPPLCFVLSTSTNVVAPFFVGGTR